MTVRRGVCAAASLALGGGLVVGLYPWVGPASGSATAIPILAFAGLWGLRVGLITAILLVPALHFLFGLAGGDGLAGILSQGPGITANFLIAAVVGHMRDLGEQLRAEARSRRQAEAALQKADAAREGAALLDHATASVGIGVALVRLDGTLAHATDTLERLTGAWNSTEAWWEAIEAATVLPKAARCARCLRPEWRFVVLADLETPRHERVVFEITATGHAHESGQAAEGHVLLVADVTQRQESEETLRRLNAELTTARDAALGASRAKSAFLANMSHELRTPLNAILGYSELIREECEDAGHEEYVADLRRIHAAGKHLLELINDVLDLSKIEAGRMEVRVEEFDARRLAEEIVGTVGPLAQLHHNEIVLKVAPDVGTMRSDHVKVRQIVFNLVGNACKFTEDGRIEVEVSREGEHVAFTVRDTGIGMDAAQLQRLFTEFWQADNSVTRKHDGTGLGLAISRRFAAMLGGDVTVESEKGKGSTFTARLAAVLQPPEKPVRSPASNPGMARAKVLVVDDDPALRDLATRHLTREGLEVVTAPDGETALREARRIRPDVITLDVLLPGMDGWRVLQALKEDADLADVPVVMVTMLDELGGGLAVGADAWLTKPLSREALVSTVQRYVGEHHQPILVVEDDEALRELVERALSREGWPVVSARDGREAIERLGEGVPSLVLLDLAMPVVDGFAVLAHLKEHHIEVPVIVVTAMDLNADARERLVGDVRSVVQKGSRSLESLVDEVCTLVAGSVRRRRATGAAGRTSSPAGGAGPPA
ncbi:MAG: response regulator [Myxococcota bacterium]